MNKILDKEITLTFTVRELDIIGHDLIRTPDELSKIDRDCLTRKQVAIKISGILKAEYGVENE